MRFQFRNTEIYFSFWFFAVIALFAVLDASALSLYFALPVLIHELGHITAIVICGAKIKSVGFTAFGVDIEKSRDIYMSYGKEAAICIAGITANVLVSLGLYFFAFQSMRVMLLIAANLAVAIFNLLPIGSLDGGCLAKLLSERFFAPELAYLLSRIFSFAALVPLFAAAIFLLLQPGRNFTLLIMCVYLAVDIAVH